MAMTAYRPFVLSFTACPHFPDKAGGQTTKHLPLEATNVVRSLSDSSRSFLRDIEFLSMAVKNSMAPAQYFCQETEMIDIFIGPHGGEYLTKFQAVGLEQADA
jgi:hypothetical protein